MILFRWIMTERVVFEVGFFRETEKVCLRTAVRGAESKHSLCRYTSDFSLKIRSTTQARFTFFCSGRKFVKLACWDIPNP